MPKVRAWVSIRGSLTVDVPDGVDLESDDPDELGSYVDWHEAMNQLEVDEFMCEQVFRDGKWQDI